MDLLNIFDVFKGYSVPIIVISAVTAVLTLITEKLFSKKISLIILGYIPFLFGMLIYSAYHFIFVNGEPFTAETLYQGIACGSLSTVYVIIAENFLRGNFSSDVVLFSIQGNLKHTVDKNIRADVAKKIKNLFEEETEPETLKERIVNVLKEYSEKSEEELYAIAAIVIQAVKALSK